MVAIYLRWVKTSRMTLADVPTLWRDQVAQQLNT